MKETMKPLLKNGFEMKPLEEGDEDFIEERISKSDESTLVKDPDGKEEKIVLKIIWIHVLWVDAAYRSQGIGSYLYIDAGKEYKSKGAGLPKRTYHCAMTKHIKSCCFLGLEA